MSKFDFNLGHDPPDDRPNIQRELRRIRTNPLAELTEALDPDADGVKVLSDDFSRYYESYYYYVLAFERYLPAMSAAARFTRGPRWVLKSGGKEKYSETDRKLAQKYHETKRFLEFDLNNCLIYTRILMDRTTALARYFLNTKDAPSYTSFNDHKRFFKRRTTPFGDHEEYAEYIRSETDWFDMPLKFVRDKIVIHASPKHFKFLGFPGMGHHLDLNVTLPDSEDPQKPLAKVKMVRVNALQLTREIEGFLTWFNAYGVRALSTKIP